MALTQKKLQDLGDVGLVEFLNGDLDLWRTKAKHAYDATHAYIAELRPDDITGLLVAELEVANEFREYLGEKKLRQKFWYQWFAELIIDRLWVELEGDET